MCFSVDYKYRGSMRFRKCLVCACKLARYCNRCVLNANNSQHHFYGWNFFGSGQIAHNSRWFVESCTFYNFCVNIIIVYRITNFALTKRSSQFNFWGIGWILFRFKWNKYIVETIFITLFGSTRYFFDNNCWHHWMSVIKSLKAKPFWNT